MSDQAPELPLASPPAALSPEFLPLNMRKHVDPSSPVPLRMMAAKTLVPLAPSDMVGALYLLTFDPDAGVQEAAKKSVVSLPDRLLSAALRDEDVPAPVLGYFLERLRDKDAYAEMLILNATTPDEAVAATASTCVPRVAEIISQNQLRLLRCDDIVRQLCLNPNASPALLDGVCDFCVRSGLILPDVPQMVESRIRIFGANAAPPDSGPTAAQVLAEHEELAQESAEPLEEQKRLNMAQKVMKMSISEKIKLATMGNKEARGILIRDSNKLVAVAVITSPRITDGEILTVANNRAALDDVIRVLYKKREYIRHYKVKLALVKNPKVPLAVAMKFVTTLLEADVKELARNKNVSSGIRTFCKKLVDKKSERPKEDH